MNKEGFLLLFYDLNNVKSEKEKRDFRVKVVGNGFIKMQESVYYKYYKNISLSTYTIKKLAKIANKNFDIKFIHLTLKQFMRMNKYSVTKEDVSDIISDIVIY